MDKNPHAVALGRQGGTTVTDAKAEAARENGRKGGRPRTHPLTPDEFFARATILSDGCWRYGQSTTDSGCYPTAMYNGRSMQASHLAWTFTYGAIPPNLHVLHKCDNPRCVNPKHLFLGTPKDNAIDRMAKGRHLTPPGGHPTYLLRNVSDALWTRVKARAAQDGLPLRALILALLRAYAEGSVRVRPESASVIKPEAPFKPPY